MNKIININLGGIPFVIDEDAYIHITKYFDSIKKHFSSSEGCDEIVYDIEVRMAELFQEKLKAKQIISMNELDHVITIMGRPEEFGAEAISETPSGASTGHKQSQNSDYKYIKTGKKLFRDEEDKVVGGVCSGIAAYLGVEDPLWVRIVFAVSVFILGVPVLLYFLLWMIVPKATTASDRLAMKGEPINIENIAKTIEDEIDDLGNKINEMGESFSSKKKEGNGLGVSAKSAINSSFSMAGDLVLSILSFIAKILKPLISTIVIGAIVVLVLMWGSIIFGYFASSDFLRYFGPQNNFQHNMLSGSLLLIVVIPIVLVIMWLFKWFYKSKSETNYSKYLIVLMIGAVISVFGFGSQTVKEYSLYEAKVNKVELPIIDNTINLKVKPLEEYDDRNMVLQLGDDLFTCKDYLFINYSDIRFEKSSDDKAYLEEKKSTRGLNENNLKQNLGNIVNQAKINGNTVEIDKAIRLQKGSLFRAQELTYTFYIPKGVKIKLDKEQNTDRFMTGNHVNMNITDNGGSIFVQ